MQKFILFLLSFVLLALQSIAQQTLLNYDVKQDSVEYRALSLDYPNLGVSDTLY